jgi:Cu/Ag efflux protein CusF
MKHPNKRTNIVIGIASGLLAGALAVAPVRADQGMTQRTGPATAERIKQETVVVTGIDRSTRSVTLQNAEGEKRSVQVPPDVKAYDTLKVGDRVDVDYQESLALSILPPGSKPSMSQKNAVSRMAEPGGTATGSRETTMSAEIMSIDVAANKVTLKGPKGQTKTVTVADPQVQKKLPTLKPGQVVQLTYT